MKTLLYVCPVCGNVIMKLSDSGVVPHCCGQAMQLLHAEMHEEAGASEKHLPKVSLLDENTLHVQVGETLHPMSKEHLVSFIMLTSEHGVQIRFLDPDSRPMSRFYCGFDRPNSVLAWCNQHGLWGTNILPSTINRIVCSRK